MRLPIFLIASVLLAMTLCAPAKGDGEVEAAALRAATERAIEIVEKSSAEYLKQRECFSCHHQAMSIMALMEARTRGLKFDMPNLQAQVQRTLDHLRRGEADYRQAKGQGGGVDTAGYALSALSAAAVAPNETTDAVVHYLLEIHSAKKHWSCSSNRPPTESNDISTTAVAMKGLARFAAQSHGKDKDEIKRKLMHRIQDCDQWLARQKPSDTEERVFRIFIAKAREALAPVVDANNPERTETDPSLAAMQKELLATQNSDGGWAQLPAAEHAASDAYATATAMKALIDSGISPQHTAYTRGLQYLLKNQEPDGSWHVATRSKPIQKYFESGFPHGVDQFLSMQATCWAIIALVQPLPTIAATDQPVLPWLNEPNKSMANVAGDLAKAKEPTAQQLEFFESEIRPLLVENCISCHGPEEQSGELRVDSLAALLKGGESGPALIPHAVERSLMIKAVRRQDELKMPPDAPLSSVNIQRLERWIEMGAPWPKDLNAKDIDKRRAAAESHWAFQLPKQHATPDVPTPLAARSAIDRFITANLHRHGLQPSEPAGRRELLRRLSYDLTGLPPTAAEFDRFEDDDRPDAVDRVIDRLLASPKFGQQWGRHWLDVARYSDTKGYVYAREERFFVHAPVYRDWVVEALSDDMPYDQFIKLQVAADTIAPDNARAQAAMGFLTLGRRFLGVTHDIIDDRIDVVSRGLLGLTVGCARCHDHKFDPIPTADYYSLYGVFQNSIERRVRISDPRPSEEYEKFNAECIKRQQKYQEQLAAEQRKVNDRILSRLTDYLLAQLELEKYPAEGFDVLIQKDDLVPAQLRRLQAYLIDAGVRQEPIFAAWRMFQAVPADQFASRAVHLCAELRSMPAERMNRLVAKQFAQPPQSMQKVAETYGQLLGHLDLVICETEADRKALQELKQLVTGDNSPFRMPEEDIVSTEQFYETRVCEALWKLQGEVDRWIIQNKSAPDFGTVLVDRSFIREPHIFRRGNPLNIAQRVPRQFLSVLCETTPPSVKTSATMNNATVSRMVSTTLANNGHERIERRPFMHGSGRRELAEAIADRRNPLTARVWVNRLWQHLMGQGLVTTPSDFGLRATAPSHPELLDNLAIDLIAHDFSSKHIIRQIVSSQSYQQASKPQSDADNARFAKANELDPDNRWLWRANARRLSFEQQRDTWLFVAGQLEEAFGGRAKQLFGEGQNNRRTLYGLVDRQFLSGVLRIFDFANPDLHIPQRSETTVPQQALFELNHDFTASVARSLAALIQSSHSNESSEVKTIAMFRQVLGRDPSTDELNQSIEFLNQPTDLVPKPREEVRDWKYGYGKFNADNNSVEWFKELPHYTGAAWQGGPKWPDDKLGWVQLTATGGHAGNDLDHAAVRRWIAPCDGTISIRSTVEHKVAAGDGIRAIVVHKPAAGMSKLLKSEVVHNTQSQFDFDSIAVGKGDTLDFVVHFNANLNSDQFLWSPEIKMQEKSWTAERDFAGKQPRFLTPWEQLAQVLLLTSELVFVD